MQQEREQFEGQIAALQAENELLNETRHHLEKTTQEIEEQNQQLQQQNQELQRQLDNIVVPAVPDYLAVRDLILKNWRVAKGVEKKERIEFALNRYIEALIGE